MYQPISEQRRTTQPQARRAYRCRCGRPIFFRNSQCLACQAQLGYEPQTGKVYSLVSAGNQDCWRIGNAPGLRKKCFRRCANLNSPSGCNWLVDASETGMLCISCRLDRTIPNLSLPENQERWRRIEVAKRRLISSLVALRLPVISRAQDPDRGLAFDFLESPENGPRVLTGHANGIITLNIEEADDSTRERIREEMREPYRTVLGHLRHETGHYYWDRLIKDGPLLDDYRGLFGDETVDYVSALESYRAQGPHTDWPLNFVSAYASAHPWEDWAETWAHYLHMLDTVDTALSFRLDPDAVEAQFEPFGSDALSRPDDPGAPAFLAFLNSWVKLAGVLNELSRSMGLADFYPFVLSKPAVAKLQFVHTTVAREVTPK